MHYPFSRPAFLMPTLALVALAEFASAQKLDLPANSVGRYWKSRPAPAKVWQSSTSPLAVSAPPNWTAGPVYSTGIARYAFAQVGQDLYVISGSRISGPVTTVARYNASTNVWTPRTSIPIGTEAPAAAYSSADNKIYVVDGFSVTSALRIYDITNNSWATGPARPGVPESYGAAAAAYQGKFFVVGGSIDPTTVLSIYDIANKSWTSGPNAPAAYQLGGYAQIGQFLYLVGSYTLTSANSNVSMRLDLTNNTWTVGPVWTFQRTDFALAASGTKLFAIGGDNTGGGFFDASTEVDELDTASWPSGSWIASPPNLPLGRQGNTAGFFTTGRVGGEIWSTGGVTVAVAFLADHLYRANLLQLASAVSRKSHGGTPFDINLPLTGNPGVECRSGASGHTLVFTFTTNIVSGSATVTSGTGTAGAPIFSGNTMTVPLTGVTDQQQITVTLNGVTDVTSQTLPSTSVSMNVLLGDTTGNKSVNASDVSQTKAQSGIALSASNFRTDTNVNGTINASDVSQVKANSGHAVP